MKKKLRLLLLGGIGTTLQTISAANFGDYRHQMETTWSQQLASPMVTNPANTRTSAQHNRTRQDASSLSSRFANSSTNQEVIIDASSNTVSAGAAATRTRTRRKTNNGASSTLRATRERRMMGPYTIQVFPDNLSAPAFDPNAYGFFPTPTGYIGRLSFFVDND